MARGLTIIEVLVVLAIFAIISGVIFFNFRGFNDVIYLERLTHDIASQIERAKRAAISGESSSSFTGKPSYGVYFSKTDNAIAYFRNLNNDSLYSPLDDTLEILYPQTGYSINKICMNGPVSSCPADDQVSNLTIVFTRPFPDAVLSSVGFSNPISNAQIEITSPEGRKRGITISVTGQVSVR